MAMPYMTKVCPKVEVEVTIHPQSQRVHEQETLGFFLQKQSFVQEALVQAIQTNATKVVYSTVSSPRMYKVYMVSTLATHLSIHQPNAGEIVLRFQYAGDEVHARVFSIEDCRYNGWVRFDCSQYPPGYIHQGNPPPPSRLK